MPLSPRKPQIGLLGWALAVVMIASPANVAMLSVFSSLRFHFAIPARVPVFRVPLDDLVAAAAGANVSLFFSSAVAFLTSVVLSERRQ